MENRYFDENWLALDGFGLEKRLMLNIISYLNNLQHAGVMLAYQKRFELLDVNKELCYLSQICFPVKKRLQTC